MKRKPHDHPATEELSGPRYWRSLDDLAQTPAFLEEVDREFGAEASQMNEVDRRNFFKIMAASFAFGGIGLAGCRRPEANILPYSKAPENVIPGQPLYYASSFSLRGESLPLLVETHVGRPTKIEGNADHPEYRGGTTRKAQASILELYDPDRSTAHFKGSAKMTSAAVSDMLASLRRQFAATRGQGLAVLVESSSSPTRRRLKQAFLEAFPEASWVEYDAVAVDNGAKAAAQVTNAANAVPQYDLAGARRILAVDADFLDEELGAVKFAKQFADARRVVDSHGEMCRLYSVESNFSLTGGMADHRKRLATSQMISFLAALALEIDMGVEGNALRPILEPLAAKLEAPTREWATRCAQDLVENRGASCVFIGAHLSPEAHALGLVINEKLGNLGRSVRFVQRDNGPAGDIRALAAAIAEGRVSTLVISGGNPVYNAPADLDFGALLAGVETVVRLGYYLDETSAKATHHISQAHYLETWGDGLTYGGDLVPQQPMILPLFDGLSEIEVLARLTGAANSDGFNLVYETYQGALRNPGRQAFDKFLHDGFAPQFALPTVRANVSGVALARWLASFEAPAAPTADALEARFVNDASVDDGRYANNGWLQECPDPMTKLTWDNAIIVSPRLAKELGIVASDSFIQVARKNPNRVRDGRQFAPVATLSVGGREVRGPVHIQPGIDNYTVILPLGYGRSKTGRIGTGAGFDAYALRVASATVPGAKIDVSETDTYQLAQTQEHWSMEGRAIIREANLDDYAANPDFVNAMGLESHTPPVYGAAASLPLQEKITATPRGGSMYQHPNHTGVHQWGMSIDLNVCFGCNACVIACQSENNIPIVGRDQVRRGREMHWIRLDRYYSSGLPNNEIPEDPQVSVQPMACAHCETAPCETVCPVNATVHDEEGLNAMVYNRCIGTRYCANNCPYKVRRFNFFDYQQRERDKLYLGPLGPKGAPELVKMVQNPDVTVRSRGVMEKCTYCVQRINQAKIAQLSKAGDGDDVRVPDGTITPACAQACPSDAIVFGDLLDRESRVTKLRENERSYSVLGYLNTRPRTTYMARLRNPNPRMPDYFDQPLSKAEYDEASHGSHGGHGEPMPAHGEHGGKAETGLDSHSDHGGSH